MKTYDVIVAGLGAMGSAALYQLSKSGVNALGIDRFGPPHDLGSSHGESRITRSAIGEGEEFVPLVLRSNEIWSELEEATGNRLLKQTGLLIFASGTESSVMHGADILNDTIRIARAHGIDHEALHENGLRERFPDLSFQEGSSGYFEPGAGYLVPELCVETNLQEARRLGAEVSTGETVIAIESARGTVKVTTDHNNYECGKLVLSAGAWIKKLLGPRVGDDEFRIFRQAMFWFETEADYSEARFPVYLKAGDDERSSYYGFPSIGGSRTIKVGIEQFDEETNPDEVDRNVTEAETDAAFELVSKSFRIRREGAKAKTCLYTVTPDYGFVIDFLPDADNVLVVSPCSGHGFKHSAGIGLLAKQLVMDEEPYTDIGRFKFQGA
ncbi:MAG: N-methyl-L-tryptophan oxidase [Acidobacteriota bacterium]|nr:MAG: N-methyl-L-tryptophan oxidase [Acidobacteriota bacterium]